MKKILIFKQKAKNEKKQSYQTQWYLKSDFDSELLILSDFVTTSVS